MKEKHCPKCGSTKPIDSFGVYRNVPSGIHYWCKSCVNAMNKPRSPTRLSWVAMKERCYRKERRNFHLYGGRGITVCERWRKSFKNFLADMGERPAGMTLDRIDVNGNYEPGNCRWATMKQQHRNRRDIPKRPAFGKEQTLSEWAEEYDKSLSLLHTRLSDGWSLERALTVPKGPARGGRPRRPLTP